MITLNQIEAAILVLRAWWRGELEEYDAALLEKLEREIEAVCGEIDYDDESDVTPAA